MKGPVSFKTLKFTTAQQTEGNVVSFFFQLLYRHQNIFITIAKIATILVFNVVNIFNVVKLFLTIQIELKLGQKYQLVLHLIELNDELTELNRCLEIPFEETEFITVTNINNPVCLYDNKLS